MINAVVGPPITKIVSCRDDQGHGNCPHGAADVDVDVRPPGSFMRLAVFCSGLTLILDV